MKQANASHSPQKTILSNESPNKYYFEQQKQIEYHDMKMRQIISKIKYNLIQLNENKNGQNNIKSDFISHFATQDLKDLHTYIHQKGNSLFLTGQYSEARQLIITGEFIDDELEKRGEVKNSQFYSPPRSKSNLISPIATKYNSPAPSAPSEFSGYSPTRPKSGFLSRKAASKIQKFDDETTEMVKQIQARHEQLQEEYVSIWEKNMQAHYFKPSKTLQELRKRLLTVRNHCLKREEQVKRQNSILQKEKSEQESNENQEEEESKEPKLEDYGDETLKELNSQFLKIYQACQQLEAKESEIAQEQYQKDYLESQRKIEDKQMMELEVFLKERILKRQKLLMNEGVNANAFKSPQKTRTQFNSRKGSPLNTRKNSPSKYKNVSKMPPLISYTKMASKNSTSPETPRNQNKNSNIKETPSTLTKEAIMELTPNITVAIPSSPALIAIEDKIKQNHEKLNKQNKKSFLNTKNNLSPIFRTEKTTQTPSINNNDLENDADDIESEIKPIPFDDNNDHTPKLHKHLPRI